MTPAPNIPELSTFICLMYHNVQRSERAYAHFSPSITSYFISEHTFEHQLRYISSARCMSPDSLSSFYGEEPVGLAGAEFTRALITFDDGWKDCVEIAGPMLQQRRLSAMLFVTTDFVGREHFLSRSDLAKIDPTLFCIGSHGRSHRMLNLLTARQIRRELADSKRYLEDASGRAVTHLSVPSGAFNPRVRLIAYEVGYRFMFTSEVHLNHRQGSPMGIGRIPITRSTSMQTFRRLLQHRLSPERYRRLMLSLPKRLLGLPRYERLRRRILGESNNHILTHAST